MPVLGILLTGTPGPAGEASPGQWVLVAPSEAKPTLTPLVEHRRTEGFKVIVIETPEVFGPAQAGNGTPLQARLRQLVQGFTGTSYILLAGAFGTANLSNRGDLLVPPLRGAVGRMDGQPTDFGYSLPNAEGIPTAHVGRFPARTLTELRGMVQKTVEFEHDATLAAWQNRLVLLVGNPGGGVLPEMFVQQSLRTHLASLHPVWELRSLVNISSSPYYLARPEDRQTALQYLQQGELFSIYLGHSGAEGMGLDARFIRRQDWSELNVAQGAGPFFTCGCWACQSNEHGDGYGLAAMRNPTGPVAVIGASGESYSAPGQLAVEGLLSCLTHPPFPERLGEYWLASQHGLARGPMDGTTFALLDAADGTGGKVPLSTQRREHLEMWMLLGDPALRLPTVTVDISLQAAGTVGAGKTVEVHGTLPPRVRGAAVRVTLERPRQSAPAGLEKVPANSAENRAAREHAFAANHHRANSFVLTAAETKAASNEFVASLTAPTNLPWARLVIRASATNAQAGGLGVVSLPVAAEAAAAHAGPAGN